MSIHNGLMTVHTVPRLLLSGQESRDRFLSYHKDSKTGFFCTTVNTIIKA